MSLRTRLIAAFFVATLLPLGATLWVTASLLDRSLGYATTGEVDRLSRTLESTVREFYQRERDALRADAVAARIPVTAYHRDAIAEWPGDVRDFWQSGGPERFTLSGEGGSRLDLMRRVASGVDRYSRDLGGIRLEELSAAFRESRQVVAAGEGRDLRRGFTLTLLLLVGVVWVLSLVPLLWIAHRVSRPIEQLTAGLTDFAAGRWDRRLEATGADEVGRAVAAFNDMAEQLRRSRERLVYLTQMSSWQSLARKTAHELKNSLTPIRLTVEEMVARQTPVDRAFMEEAARIVVTEIETLERRVRAFSELSSEPAADPAVVGVNALVTERIALLRAAHPGTVYTSRLDERSPQAYASVDLVKGILTNLLENAAEAAGSNGQVLAVTRNEGSQVIVEVHDSGPGLSEEARATIFEPTITFKARGMGLGLSIARKNALLVGGDVSLVEGELGGAGFRVVLPAALPHAAAIAV